MKKTTNRFTRILSLMLALVMVLTMFPTGLIQIDVFADSEAEESHLSAAANGTSTAKSGYSVTVHYFNSDNWNAVHNYVWDNGGKNDYCSYWPGRQIAEKIASLMDSEGTQIELIADAHPEEQTVLSNQLYAKEIGLNFFCETDKVIAQTLTAMQKNRDAFLNENQTEQPKTFGQAVWQKLGWLFEVIAPYLENLICFIPFFLLNMQASSNVQ